MTNPKERGATHATLTLADPVQAQAGGSRAFGPGIAHRLPAAGAARLPRP